MLKSMRHLFLRFYLTVVVFFLLSSLLVGAIYKHVLHENNRRYFTDIFHTTLFLVERELREVPQKEWPQKVTALRGKLAVPIGIERIDSYRLNNQHSQALVAGEIVLLEDQERYLQRIPNSDFILTLGPVDYLYLARKLSWVDVLALLSLALALGIPAFVWLRPLQAHTRQLSEVSLELGRGNFSARSHLPDSSPLVDLGAAMNSMARNMGELVDSRKTLIDAVSHDLRTPIARLRYRVEALRGVEEPPVVQKVVGQMDRDLDSLNEMTEELLIFSRLERPEMRFELQSVDVLPWLQNVLSELSWQNQAPQIHNLTGQAAPRAVLDGYYMARAITNLVINARRHCRQHIALSVEWQGSSICVHVDDDGPGIPPEARAEVLRPFTRLDKSRSQHTGGHGLGLAIVGRIIDGHQGRILIDDAPLGGARLTLQWPVPAASREGVER